jgi:AcrR family transcriptional regulator
MTEVVVPDLKIVPREGGYARGHEGLEQILRAAFRILVDQGHEAFTLRRIAAEAGMSQGNLSYYFKSKQELFQALIEAMAAGYGEAVESTLLDPDMTPEQRFRRVIAVILQDITTKKTTRIFTQLWSLANYDPFVQERLDDVYRTERTLLETLIEQINPRLSARQREILALFICSSLEGLTVFAGYEKPWRSSVPWIEPIAADSFLHLIRTMHDSAIGVEPAA